MNTHVQHPFQIIPWNNNFLEEFVALCAQESAGNFSKILCIFPHARPARYLKEYIQAYAQQHNQPALFLPQYFPIQQFVTKLSVLCFPQEFMREPTLLEKIIAVKTATCTMLTHDETLATMLHDETSELFFPWAQALLSTLDELYVHGVTPQAIDHEGENIPPLTTVLLKNLGAIHKEYTRLLQLKNWTTKSLQLYTLAQALQKKDPAFLQKFKQSVQNICKDKKIFIAGFGTVTAAESLLCKYLWQHHNAQVCLHSHFPTLIQENSAQQGDTPNSQNTPNSQDTQNTIPTIPTWPCNLQKIWIHSWNAHCEEFVSNSAQVHSPAKPHISFYQGHDLHSQLSKLQTLSRQEQPAKTGSIADLVILLPQTDLLLPALHHIADKNCNISMGYPLETSSLAKLVSSVVQLCETAKEHEHETLYYWKSLLLCIRHPYIKSLSPDGEKQLRPLCNLFEKQVRKGLPYLNLKTTVEIFFADLTLAAEKQHNEQEPTLSSTVFDSACHELFKNVLHTITTPWAQVTSPALLAKALQDLCTLLIEAGHSLWAKHPIDNECLYRLMHSVQPAFSLGETINAQLPRKTLFSLLEQSIKAERVPFEAEPLAATQILGMLEARLLHFKKVIILDAIDSSIPGASNNDPLLPDAIRRSLGLPHTWHKDALAAYNFYRLLAGAEEAHILYQNAENHSGLLDTKKIPSRFVQELVWQEEKKRKNLLELGTAPLYALSSPITPIIKPQSCFIEKTDAIQQQLTARMEKSVSASFLDSYITCPYSFFYRYIAPITALQEVQEEPDTAEIGTLLHDTLADFLQPFIGKQFLKNPQQLKELHTLFLQNYEASALSETLPLDSALFFKKVAPIKLFSFLKNQPQEFFIKALETELSHIYSPDFFEHTPIHLVGRIDRVDERATENEATDLQNETLIVDYKSGSVYLPTNKVWEADDFWQGIHSSEAAQNPESIAIIAKHIPSLQLPYYIFLYGLAEQQTASNACYISLKADDVVEKELFSKKIPLESRLGLAKEAVPQLINFTMKHIIKSPCFMAQPGNHCTWCMANRACSMAKRT